MAMIKCKECKKKISSGAESCPNCGCPQPFDMVECKKCKEEIPAGVDKCPHCNKPQATFGESVMGVLILVAIFFAVKYFFFGDDEPSKTPAQTYAAVQNQQLKAINALTSNERAKIYNAFYQQNQTALAGVGQERATACLADHVHNKSANLKFSEVAGWCLKDAANGEPFGAFYNPDKFAGYFSAWDGSLAALETAVKRNMHDPDSFEHDETRYRLERGNDDIAAVVTMKYRGKNAYGGVVTEYISVRMDPNTGEILEVIE